MRLPKGGVFHWATLPNYTGFKTFVPYIGRLGVSDLLDRTINNMLERAF